MAKLISILIKSIHLIVIKLKSNFSSQTIIHKMFFKIRKINILRTGNYISNRQFYTSNLDNSKAQDPAHSHVLFDLPPNSSSFYDIFDLYILCIVQIYFQEVSQACPLLCSAEYRGATAKGKEAL